MQHYKALFSLGLPIVIGQIGVIILGFADTLMIGHHSTNELAAASFVNNMFTLAIIFATGFSYGLTPVVGSLFGRGETHVVGESSYFQDSNIVWINNDESKVLNTYLYYCYQLRPWKASAGGTISRLYNDNIRKTVIPVPSIPEQERIVAILDRFDTLCNDLTSSLLAEIQARQKQYEYYRDKLLSFKEASV